MREKIDVDSKPMSFQEFADALLKAETAAREKNAEFLAGVKKHGLTWALRWRAESALEADAFEELLQKVKNRLTLGAVAEGLPEPEMAEPLKEVANRALTWVFWNERDADPSGEMIRQAKVKAARRFLEDVVGLDALQ